MADSHPDLVDRDRRTWTWRGQGYAILGQPDTDWLGRPWTTSQDTVRREFGARPVPAEPRMR